jgi:hypothetical protein
MEMMCASTQSLSSALTAIAPLSSAALWKQNFAKKKNLRIWTETFTLQFKDGKENVTALQVKPWQTIKETKRKLAEATAPQGFELLIDNDKLVSQVMRQRLFFQGQVLKDSKTLQDYSLKEGDVIYRLAQEDKSVAPSSVEPSVEVVLGNYKSPPELLSVIDGCRKGLSQGLSPVLASSGLGGTYFLRDHHEHIVGVFKPEDEEAYAPNNPRGLPGRMGSRGVRNGLLSGEANVREVAAYLLDHDHFANVPMTVRVEVSHPTFGPTAKIGSLQEFKLHDEEAGDVSSSLFTVEGAHRISIMDMRLLNRDRNDENLLVRKTSTKGMELIPIDHGCSLPDTFEVNWHDWAWLSWPQTKQPLSDQEKAYIARLDAALDVALLEKELSIRWQCLLVLRIATCFLQKGAAADLSLFDIACMMSRDEYEKPSVLEIVFAQAKTLAEGKRRGGNPKRRRSPNVSPAALPTPQPRKLRRSRSMCSLDFDAFKLPGASPTASSQVPADDCGTWAFADSCEEVFDEEFWKYLDDLMDTAISRRQMKRQAVEQLKTLIR